MPNNVNIKTLVDDLGNIVVPITHVNAVFDNEGHTLPLMMDRKYPIDSKIAEEGGTALSLVSTGEKYNWNNKGSYSKPSGGIPSTDMDSSVQSSLSAADSAYQKPSGGIPDTDLSSAVQLSLGKADTALQSHLSKADIGLGNVTNDALVKRTEMGAALGVATLDSNGKVPSSQLPSYVDDVLEYASTSAFPATGETGKIYVAVDTNRTYRWSGSGYTEISESLALGETSSTAYAGDKGKALADKLSGIESGAQAHKAPTTAEVKSALGTGSGTSKYLREDGTWLTPPDNNTTYSAGTGLSLSGTTFSLALTKALVTSALGYTPPTTDTNTTYSAGTGLSLSGTTFSVKTGYTTSGKNYKVAADSNGNLYVNVPWSDNNTTYSGSSTVTLSGTTFSLTKANVTTALGYTPPTSDTNTWRTVQCNGTSIGNNTLNLKPGTNVSLSNSNGTITITSTDTNTWRGILNNLTSTSTTDSLSAYQGYLLANGSARDSSKLSASNFTNNNKGTSVGKIMVADASNGLGYSTPSDLVSVLNAVSSWCPINFRNVTDNLNIPIETNGIVVGNFYNGAANIPDNYGSYLSINFGDAAIQFAVGTQSISYCNKKAYVRIRYNNSIEGWHQLD